MLDQRKQATSDTSSYQLSMQERERERKTEGKRNFAAQLFHQAGSLSGFQIKIRSIICPVKDWRKEEKKVG